MEELRFHALDELGALSVEELQALWDLVPTDRQKAYRQAYDREVRNAGALGSDGAELQVTEELLRRYADTALVPVGSRWARTPNRIQEAAQQNDALQTPEDGVGTGRVNQSRRVAILFGVMAALFIGLLFVRMLGGGGGEVAEATLTVTPTQTPEVSPTPTPLALEDQDNIIQGGDAERVVAYPVNLQVVLPDGSTPRVWVVQRRAVSASEWHYDTNPDTASFINGMSVRPVIGIPWSEDNAAWFTRMGAGAVFNVTMNTGAVLRYEFAARTDVMRSETSIFRQVSPGLVLLLIGETDEDGLPTTTRTLVTATYPPEQELSRGGELVGLDLAVQEGAVGETLPLGDAAITLRDVQTVSDASGLPPGQQVLLLNIDVAAGDAALNTALWRTEITDAGGQVYLPASSALTHADYGSPPAEVPALALIPASFGYLVPGDLAGGRWTLTDGHGEGVTFRFTLAAPTPPPTFGTVDVRLVSVTYTEGQLTTRLRIFNGEAEPLRITQDDIWLALGYAPDPPGPRNPAEGLTPFDLLPEQAADLVLVWYWAGEPYGALQVGAWRFAIEIYRY